MARCIALIVAAGRGSRFGADMPKQYAMIGRRCVLAHAAQAFLDHPEVDAVRVVIHHDDEKRYRDATKGMNLMAPVFGGATRQQSVRAGLESLKNDHVDVVLIHDGARPFVSPTVISDVIAAVKDAAGAIPALPVVDTLKRERRGPGQSVHVGETVSRENLWRAQTPQGFRYDAISLAHEKARGQSMTDDDAIAQAAGLDVEVVPGDEDNFKVTTREDLFRAERLLRDRMGIEEYRSGTGYDVHRFAVGDHLYLCGIRIPFVQRLEGHSDADVALHALCDALLGSIADGDIGDHFPPSSSQWKDANSETFVRFALGRITQHGGRLINVDITIICEAPKIGPHRESMRDNLSEILGIGTGRISVKATTTEGLGFCGRGEGIAAQALVQIGISRKTAI